jgi:histidinol-phosphate aminotransferase
LPIVQARVHGGADPVGPAMHDFSTNSNACGPCPDARAAVCAADAAAYPDASYSALRDALADFHGVDGGRIVLAASASEFIFRITAWAAKQRGKPAVWLPAHAYGDYAQAASAHRLTRVLDASHALLRWVCDPSSPLGQACKELDGVVNIPGGTTVLDRAYEPLRLEGNLVLQDDVLDTVWQLWTPNKEEGLFAAHALEQLCPSWPLGAHGVAMLHAWTRDATHRWLADSLVQLRKWKAAQLALCESLGWVCEPSQANFFFARPALPDGVALPAVLAGLRLRGIKLRDTASFGLPGGVRVSVLAPAAQDALHNAWHDMTKVNP